MNINLLADECLNANIVYFLREKKLVVNWILEDSAGISDKEVIDIALQSGQVLITEDKDFGEWVFAHKVSGLSIIFLRYEKLNRIAIQEYLFEVIQQIASNEISGNHFITINKNKIRIRRI